MNLLMLSTFDDSRMIGGNVASLLRMVYFQLYELKERYIQLFDVKLSTFLL